LEAFKKLISTVPGWSVSSYGGYFSYVKFPDSYGQATSEEVAERLAKECGVLTLPGIWFMPAKGSKEWKGMDTRGSEIVQDRWIRLVHSSTFGITSYDVE
jgi:aspartate/methionine/tyrosine aminotransferase